MNPLTRAFDGATRGSPGFCQTCAGPTPRGQRIVVLEVQEKLAKCVACGRPVDGGGRSLGALRRDGTVELSTIRLCRIRRNLPPPDIL